MIEWAREVNAILLEFEGQLTLSDIHGLTRKEIYYLRKERQAYHIKMKEQADKAAAEAKAAQEKEAQRQGRNYNRGMRPPHGGGYTHNQGPATQRSKGGRQPRRK